LIKKQARTEQTSIVALTKLDFEQIDFGGAISEERARVSPSISATFDRGSYLYLSLSVSGSLSHRHVFVGAINAEKKWKERRYLVNNLLNPS